MGFVAERERLAARARFVEKLLDRDARVVGVIFDNNIHALGGEYFYDIRLNRSVSVSASVIRLALADVYGMQELLAELERR